MNEHNDAIRAIVERVMDTRRKKTATAITLPAPPDDPKPEDFKFLESPDAVGLPQTSPLYADKNCRTCYGRGVKRYVVVDRTVGEVFDDPGRQVRNPKRRLEVCDCVHRGYGRVRRAHDKDLDKTLKEHREVVIMTREALGLTDEEWAASGNTIGDTEEGIKKAVLARHFPTAR